MDEAIETSGLRREFGDLVAVDDLDLTVEAGTFFGFLGPSGAGNFVSPALPVARNISKIGSSPSQTGVFISFAVLFVNVIVIGGLVVIGGLADSPWAQPVLLSILVTMLAAAYRIMLAPAAQLLEERRKSLIEAVQSPT